MFEADLTGGATDTHDPRDARGGGPGYSRARRLLRGSLADQALTNALDHDRLAGALLFYGPSGVGKWAAASLLAAALNCPRRDKDSALGSEHEWNPASRQIFAGSFPDFLWVAPQPSSKNETEEMELANDFFQQKRHEPLKVVRWSRPSRISIERARRIKRRLFQTPAPGVTRVVVFYEIETMAHGAVDSLLKMIEEPPPRTVFILISDQPEAAPPTALSRCKRVRFAAPPLERALSFLEETSELGDSQRNAITRLAQNSPGLALEFAEDLAGTATDGVSGREVSWLTFKVLLLEPGAVALDALLNSVDFRNRSSISKLIDRWRWYIRDLVMLSADLESEVANIDLVAELKRLSRIVPPVQELGVLADRFASLQVNLRHNVNAPLALADLSIAIRSAFCR